MLIFCFAYLRPCLNLPDILSPHLCKYSFIIITSSQFHHTHFIDVIQHFGRINSFLAELVVFSIARGGQKSISLQISVRLLFMISIFPSIYILAHILLQKPKWGTNWQNWGMNGKFHWKDYHSSRVFVISSLLAILHFQLIFLNSKSLFVNKIALIFL